TGPAKSSTIVLTAAGFARIAGSIPEENVGSVAKAVAESLPATELVGFLQGILPKVPTAAPELEPLLANAVRRQEVEAAERVAAERERAERLEASRAAFQRCMDHLARLQAARVGELTEMLLAAGGTVPEQPETPPQPLPQGERGSDLTATSLPPSFEGRGVG